MASKETGKTKNQVLVCPECGITCNEPRTLGSHRRFKHGVKGSAPSTLAGDAKKAAEKAKKALQPENVAEVPVTMPYRQPEPTGLIVRPAAGGALISPTMLAYTVGRLESLAEKIARENGFPENEFVSQAAKSFWELMKK